MTPQTHPRKVYPSDRHRSVCRSRGYALLCGLVIFLAVSIAELPLHAFQRGRSGAGYGRGSGIGQPYRGMPGSASASREHLPDWFRQHENLPLAEQQRALRTEPGFSRLPPAEQQRLYQRLQQLDAMPPAQRERTLARMEALERMSPEQRQRVRMAMQQVTAMPPDRQRMLRKAFRDLSQLSPAERKSMLNSPEFQQQFSNQERQTLGTLLTMQPYQPSTPNSSR